MGFTTNSPDIPSSISDHPDIVIVGAGAAGISAGHTLAGKGYDIAILEASNRIGGRVWTDQETFSTPCDMGAHWLHYDSDNFYKNYGERNGFDIYPDNLKVALYNHGQIVENGAELIPELLGLMDQAIQESADTGIDVSMADATENFDHPMSSIARFILGPWTMGKELEKLSVLDYASMKDSIDWYCKEGFGTLVAHYGSKLPVSLDTIVEAIDWRGNDLRISTNRGNIRSKAVIVTVSTGVLASDAIKFNPALPAEKLESFDSISMGCYEHIWLEFSTPIAGLKPDTYILNFTDEPDSTFGASANASGSTLTYFDVGGQIADELSRHSKADRVNFALDRLRSIFGSEIDQTFVKGSASSWATDPLTVGSYASAQPGAFNRRDVLREPIADRIFFAGEACHQTMFASVAGAHLSGGDTAEQLMGIKC